MDDLILIKARVQQPCDAGNIPDHTVPDHAPAHILLVVADDLIEIVAQAILSLQPLFQLRSGRSQMGHNAHARKLHQRHAGIHHDARGSNVLKHVEFAGIRPMVCVSAQPDDDDLVRDLRLHQKRGGHVGDCGDGQHIQRRIVRTLHGKPDQILRSLGIDRCFLIRQETRGAAACKLHQLGSAAEVQNILNFPIAALHAERGRLGTFVLEGRGINPLDIQLIVRGDHIGQRKLIVHFIIGIRVQNDINRLLRPAESV